MRIKAIHAKNIQPIRFIEVGDLSDVVVLAGPNGVGKTRLLKWLLQFFQNFPSTSEQWIQVEATSTEERTQWGQHVLDTRQQNDIQKLRQTLQQNRRRAQHESSVLNFESDRSITQVQPYQFTWDYQDPFIENIAWTLGFNNLSSRFQDTIHSIFRKIRSRRESIAEKAEQLIKAREQATPAKSEEPSQNTIELNVEEFPDPLIPFKQAFSQLLAPKVLLTPEVKNQQLSYQDGDATRSLPELSSGEREVVNIVFDFLLRNPRDCIVLFDEPELHLHPELSYKLLQTLKNSGIRNQFIFCTHSADIISASLDKFGRFHFSPQDR
jgi:predicted ATP-dependent endonuclease of OLD family